MNSLASFLQQLATEGVALVDRTERMEAAHDAVSVWRGMEESCRADLPGEAPAVDEAAGLWAAGRLFFACQAIVCRDLDTEEVRPRIMEPCPTSRGPSTDYSADICLRHLHDVARLARQLSASDPVTTLIQEFASAWPLSAVGIPDMQFTDLATFWEHSTLRRLFVDRVLIHQCADALRHAAVADAVRAAIGAHDELSPSLAAALHALNVP